MRGMPPREKAVWYAAIRHAAMCLDDDTCGYARREDCRTRPRVSLTGCIAAFVDALVEAGESPGTWGEIQRAGVTAVGDRSVDRWVKYSRSTNLCRFEVRCGLIVTADGRRYDVDYDRLSRPKLVGREKLKRRWY